MWLKKAEDNKVYYGAEHTNTTFKPNDWNYVNIYSTKEDADKAAYILIAVGEKRKDAKYLYNMPQSIDYFLISPKDRKYSQELHQYYYDYKGNKVISINPDRVPDVNFE